MGKTFGGRIINKRDIVKKETQCGAKKPAEPFNIRSFQALRATSPAPCLHLQVIQPLGRQVLPTLIDGLHASARGYAGQGSEAAVKRLR